MNGENLWENCIDDMNSDRSWSVGGLLITSKKKANDLRKYLEFYNDGKKFKVVEVKLV